MGYLGKDGDQYYAAAKAEELVGGRKQVEGGENADEET